MSDKPKWRQDAESARQCMEELEGLHRTRVGDSIRSPQLQSLLLYLVMKGVLKPEPTQDEVG